MLRRIRRRKKGKNVREKIRGEKNERKCIRGKSVISLPSDGRRGFFVTSANQMTWQSLSGLRDEILND